MAKAMRKYFRENFDGACWNHEYLAQQIFPAYSIFKPVLC